MKIQVSQNRYSAGSTLIAVVVAVVLLSGLLISYLTLLHYTNRTTMRSQVWNSAIPIAEAGIDDALTHLNVHGASTNIACDGWQVVSGTSVYWLERTIGENKYLVTISNFVASASTNNRPVIESRAFVKPILASLDSASPHGPFLAAAGANPAQNNYFVRGVRVTTGKKNSSSKGVLSKGSLQFQSVAGIVIDSYDSSSSTYSTGGMYDSTKAKQNGFVGTNSRNNGDMQVQGNLKIVGIVGTGASGVLSMQSPASVGDLAWVNDPARAGQIQAGHLDSNLNVPFPDVTVPFTGGYFAPGSGSVGGTNYTYLLNVEGGKYQKDKIELMSSSEKMLVTANATLYVTDTMKLDNGQIIVAPNVKLSVYVEKAFEAKNNAAINATGVPAQFFYYGRPQNTSFQVLDNTKLVGVFYAPQANAQFQHNSDLSGGGSFGTLQIQHSVKFHYDEALGGSSDQLFFVTSWDEMDPQVAATIPSGVQFTLP